MTNNTPFTISAGIFVLKFNFHLHLHTILIFHNIKLWSNSQTVMVLHVNQHDSSMYKCTCTCIQNFMAHVLYAVLLLLNSPCVCALQVSSQCRVQHQSLVAAGGLLRGYPQQAVLEELPGHQAQKHDPQRRATVSHTPSPPTHSDK